MKIFPFFSASMMLRAPEGDAPAAGGGDTPSGATLFGSSSASSSAPAGDTASNPTPAQSNPEPAAAWSWTKDEGGAFGDGWQDRLPEDLRANPSLKIIHNLPDLAKAYVETKGLVGKKLEMPGEGATPDQISAWRKTVGAPEKPEGYRGDAKTLRPESLPEEMWNEKAENEFLAIAHKYHLPPAAVKDILNFYGGSLVNELNANQSDERAMLAAETTKLKEEWKEDFDSNLALASRMAKTVGLNPLTDPIFTHASVVQAFAKMGKLVSGDTLISGEQPSAMNSLADRARDISDPKSQSILAREYRGEFGSDRQVAAQTQLHQLLSLQKAK